jgi:hypothetical protein
MEYILVFGIMFIVVALISWRWVEGIDYMHKNHPDYKGHDLFGDFEDGAPWENKEAKDNNEPTEGVV